MSFQNLRIGARLYLAFGLVLALLLAIALLGANRIAVMQQGLQDIILVNDAEIALASTMRQTVDDRMIALRNIVLLTSPEEMRPEIERVSEQSRLFDVAVADMHKVFDSYPGTSDEERQALAKVEAAAGEASPIMQKVVTLGSANQGAEAIKVLMQELRPVQRKWRDGLAALVDSETRQNHEAVEEAGAAYRHALLAIGSITALAMLFGGFIAWAITRGIVVPLKHAVKVAQNVAQGDLTSRIVVRGTDESAELMGALGSMNGSLADLVTSVRASATAVSSSSAEIAAGNSDLSARTEEQASSLEETAAAMEELTTTVRANADNAAQANQLVTVAAQIVAEGGTAVGRVVATMDAISTSSKKITEIIGVIDGIAFQTNILALNAAVEAARAGEQGRGFAVVASEVRNLAHRSATAAREIKELITASVDRVEDGNQLALAAGATMQRALDSVQQVSGIMTEISQASREQSGGIAQVNTAIVNMDMVTQQNAALVEEAAAAATAMSQQAAGLTAQIARFRTGNGAGRHPAMLAAA